MFYWQIWQVKAKALKSFILFGLESWIELEERKNIFLYIICQKLAVEHGKSLYDALIDGNFNLNCFKLCKFY